MCVCVCVHVFVCVFECAYLHTANLCVCDFARVSVLAGYVGYLYALINIHSCSLISQCHVYTIINIDCAICVLQNDCLIII